MKKFILFFLLLGSLLVSRENDKPSRLPAYPYISGDAFRDHCDYVFDETNRYIPVHEMKEGSTIFVKTDLVGQFFSEYHLQIPVRYIVVSHNSDHPAPGPHAEYLNDDKIIAWFSQNVEKASHPKLHPIPIGIENRYNGHGDPEHLNNARRRIPGIKKSYLAYLNINIDTYPKERQKVYDLFRHKDYVKAPSPKPYKDYLYDLAGSKFVFSPRGNGLDCHRTWEALYMGAYPIVRTSSSDEMYEDLPVLIIKKWADVDEEFLEKSYKQLSKKTYNAEKLKARYWLNFIDSFKP